MINMPSFAQVRAQVKSIRDRYPDARAIGIGLPALDEAMPAPPVLRVGSEELPVMQCGSVLALRERLVDLPAGGPPARRADRPAAGGVGRRPARAIRPPQSVFHRALATREGAVQGALRRPASGRAPCVGGPRAPRRGARGRISPGAERFPGCRDGLATSVRDDYRKPAWRTGPGGAPRLGDGWRSRADTECPAAGGAGGIARRGGGRRGTYGAGDLRMRGATRAPDGLHVGLVARVLFDADAKGDERAAKARGKLEALLDLQDLNTALARAWTDAAERVVQRRLSRTARLASAGIARHGRGGARRCR